jgi:O-succinylbenzoic acid--CoA ligase
VALTMVPSRAFVEVLHACQRLRAVVVPLPLNGVESEWAAQIEIAKPRWIVCDQPNERRAAVVAEGSGVVRIDVTKLGRRAYGSDREIEPGGPTDPYGLVFTSGTTGHPKAAVLSHGATFASAVTAAERLDFRSGEAWLCALPLHHVGGLSMLIRAAIVGAAIVLRPRFDANAFLSDIEKFDVRHASVVPTMLSRLVAAAVERSRRAGLARCRLLVGGAPLAPELAAKANEAGCVVRATYGLTEASSQVATSEDDGDVIRYPGSSGRPLRGLRIAIDGPDRDDFGEIRVSGPQLFSGYFVDDVATRCVLRDGWLATGDTARVDADGRLYVSSRREDLIVSGGENVRPEEVERVLESHPTVAEAGVFGLPDEEWGETVSVVVVARDGATIDPSELVEWCRARLAPFKIPRRIETAASLPRTPGGKLMRAKLRG